MSRYLPWYKRDVDAWRGGTRCMSLELRGFYSECLDAMWDRQGPIEKDVAKLAVLLCCNPRSVRKLLPQLIALGKLIETPEGYVNPRMMAEIAEANSSSVQRELAPNSRGIQREFEPKVAKKLMNSTRVLEEDVEVEADPPPTPPRGERDDPLRLYNEYARVTVFDGKVTLHNGLRQFWLEQFGGDEIRLDLALTQVAAYVQPNSRRPLEAQVSSQLARIAADKRDRDQRYASAAARNTAAPKQTVSFRDQEIDRIRAVRERMRASAGDAR